MIISRILYNPADSANKIIKGLRRLKGRLHSGSFEHHADDPLK